ncbi:MAG: polysaccharide deacetylase family protein [Gammaproteobacteria bacterium]
MIWKASVALHVGAVAATVVDPHLWPWSLGAVAANHATLTFAGLWPRSSLLGPNWTRLPHEAAARNAVAMSIDDGPDPATTPRVLDILDAHTAKATFFCIGQRIERFRGLARDIHDRGHAIENHSFRHTNYFSLLGPKRMASEIERAQDVIASVTGAKPRFFRAPAGLRNPFLAPLLRRFDLQLASWTRRGFDTVEGNADVVFRRVTRNLASGDILLLHDGNAAKGISGAPVIYDVLPRILREIAAQDLRPILMRDALTAATLAS